MALALIPPQTAEAVGVAKILPNVTGKETKQKHWGSGLASNPASEFVSLLTTSTPVKGLQGPSPSQG